MNCKFCKSKNTVGMYGVSLDKTRDLGIRICKDCGLVSVK